MDIRTRPGRIALAALPALLLLTAAGSRARAAEVETPPEFKVAFLGDQGLGGDAEAVLRLVRAEGAEAVLHLGDFDYANDPAAWEARIDSVLGREFPYFACVGNHDALRFFGRGGYQERLAARMRRLGIPWEGILGVRSSFRYQGILVVTTAPGVFGDGDLFHAGYIRRELAWDDSLWSIAGWHENMRAMQVGGKGNSTGWGVYEASRRGGARAPGTARSSASSTTGATRAWRASTSRTSRATSRTSSWSRAPSRSPRQCQRGRVASRRP